MQIRAYDAIAMVRNAQWFDVPHLIISISDGRGKPLEFAGNENCRGELHLSLFGKGQEQSLFAKEGSRMRSFVEGRSDDVELIACTCDLGISRSPALAAALSLFMDEDDWPFWGNPARTPSVFLFRASLEVLGVELNEDDIERRLLHNRSISDFYYRSRFRSD